MITTMINHAMFADRNKFNSFTTYLKDNSSPFCIVRLRNNSRAKVMYNKFENVFHTADWKFVWNPDGSSVTKDDFDIVEIPHPV